MSNFHERYQEALYGRVPIHAGVPQLKADLSVLADTSLVYSDVVLHLPVLEWFASQCDHVTEFGVRHVVSTLALLAGVRRPGGMVVSYDVRRTAAVDCVLGMDLPARWQFHERSSVDPRLRIEPTDMLFIDTEHTGTQVAAELRQAERVRRFLAFHDTETFRDRDRFLDTVLDFLRRDGWTIVYQTRHNNGLLVAQRC